VEVQMLGLGINYISDTNIEGNHRETGDNNTNSRPRRDIVKPTYQQWYQLRVQAVDA